MAKPTTKNEALAERQTTALARPSFIQEGDQRGTENIGQDDIKPPALKIAQSQSPEIKRSEPAKYIDGLREGELFNSLTREVYGEGPVNLIFVNQLGHRHVEFEPGNTGKVLDFNVPDGDPRTQFTTEVKDGKQVRVKPVATKFYDYLILVISDAHPEGELMTLSLKSTQLKKAVKLNTILVGSKVPAFAHLFKATPVPEKAGQYSIYGWLFEPVGWVTEEQYNRASEIFEQFKGKTIAVETDGADGIDEPAAADKIPF